MRHLYQARRNIYERLFAEVCLGLTGEQIAIMPYRFNSEAMVFNCGHKGEDKTIYFVNDKQHWKKVFSENSISSVMTSIISHETLHLVLTDIESDLTSLTLDIPFGEGKKYRRDYNGLFNYDKVFCKYWNGVWK